MRFCMGTQMGDLFNFNNNAISSVLSAQALFETGPLAGAHCPLNNLNKICLLTVTRMCVYFPSRTFSYPNENKISVISIIEEHGRHRVPFFKTIFPAIFYAHHCQSPVKSTHQVGQSYHITFRNCHKNRQVYPH